MRHKALEIFLNFERFSLELEFKLRDSLWNRTQTDSDALQHRRLTVVFDCDFARELQPGLSVSLDRTRRHGFDLNDAGMKRCS